MGVSAVRAACFASREVLCKHAAATWRGVVLSLHVSWAFGMLDPVPVAGPGASGRVAPKL